MRRTTLRGRLAVSFLALALVIGSLGVGIIVSMSRLDAATVDRVERLGPALLETETLARSYSDQETGLRGYLVARREDFLEPYRSGRQVERRSLAKLQTLLAVRPDLLRLLVMVRAEADSWHDQVAVPAILRVRNGGAAELSLLEVERGKTGFDRVRAALERLQSPVRAARDEATIELYRNQDRLRVILILGLGLLMVVASLTWLGLRRWVTRPLERLGAEVDRVEAGDLQRRVSVTNAPVEIGVLAEQVDRMRSRVLHEFAIAEKSRLEALVSQATIEAQAADLRRSNDELEQFAYVASHDLQEPLRKVASFCQLIERRYKGQLDERGDQYIGFAVDGAKRMQQLINDLLAFSRVGRSGVGVVAVDLEEVLAQAEHQLEMLIDEAGAVVTHDSLPTIQGDRSLLVQLLQNLIGNAVKFRGKAPPRVHLGAAPSTETWGGSPGWELWCADNGIGIEEQYRDKIFVIFQRLHARDAYGGTGIGLAMCRKIVEYHGGRLWLDPPNPSGGGAVFRFTLPERAGQRTDSAPLHPPEQEHATP